MYLTRIIFVFITLILTGISSMESLAQRRITPVEPKAGTIGTPVQPKNDEPTRPTSLEERKDAQGNIVLVDTITGQEWVDSTAITRKAKMIYPLLESVSVGVNIWDPVMKMFGQKYGGMDVWAELSLHNRYKPIFEFGMSSCDDTPEEMNYTFKSKLAPYFRIGMNYNIFYNNSPNYQFCVGMRYGFTPFTYQVTDVTVSDGYWNEPTHFDLPRQSTTAGYFELVASVKVMIIKSFSLGWSIKYHSILHEGKSQYGKPMYIPGFGKRGNSFTGSFSIIYTIPLNNRPIESVN